jgi:DNA-binding transcriptional LysR family regulator
VAEASNEISDLGKEPRGLVRVSIAPEHGEGLVSPLLAEFVRRYPKIRIDLLVTNRRVNLIEESVDLALRAGALDDSTLVARKLAVSELALFAAPSYLERRGRPRRFSDLKAHDCVLHRSARGILPWHLSGPRGIERVAVSGPITADDLGSVRLLTLSGVGIALMPDMLVSADVQRGALVRVLPRYAMRGAVAYLVSAPLRHVPARVTLLRDFLMRGVTARLAGTACAVDTTVKGPDPRAPTRTGAAPPA